MPMKRCHALLKDDAGFSLTELIVVVGLLPIVLAMAWGGLMYATTSSAVSTTQGTAARDFGNPMEQMSRVLMQNTSIAVAESNRIEVLTDRNMDGLPESNIFYVTADNRLVFERLTKDSAGTVVLSRNTWVLSTSNKNVSSNAPLFVYYDNEGAEIPAAEIAARAPSEATAVRVRLVVDMGKGRTAQDVRDVTFRTKG